MTDKTYVDMNRELFIPPTRDLVKLTIPPKARGDYLKILDTTNDDIARLDSLDMLSECYRCDTTRNAGWFAEGECEKLIKEVLLYSKDHKDIEEAIGVLFVREGIRSENARDYDSAFKFYEASLKFGIYNPEFRYGRLKNLGFCLCLKGQFDRAEEFLRGATAMEPERYGGWKNLGVALEHQGRFQEAADCYRKAIDCSRGEQRCVRHYKRLLARRPELRSSCPPL